MKSYYFNKVKPQIKDKNFQNRAFLKKNVAANGCDYFFKIGGITLK
jgi:hypothetical protein